MSIVSLSEKFRNAAMAIRQNGGLWKSIQTLYRIDELKDGKLVGLDRNGNKYFENKRYFIGRSRWVVYHERYGLDYDASHIDPEWYPWLHYTNDEPPTSVDPITYKWVDAKPKEHRTGTPGQYVPYSTQPPKVTEWKPPAPKN